MKADVYCPIDESVLRVEQGSTGFCGQCCKHYPLCTATHFTEGCIFVAEHAGRHRTSFGEDFGLSTDPKEKR